MRKKVVI